jgi:hypothetical protein
LASPVKYRRFFDIVGASPGRHIFDGVPQRLGRGVQAINGFVGLTARVVPVCGNLSGPGTSIGDYYARSTRAA